MVHLEFALPGRDDDRLLIGDRAVLRRSLLDKRAQPFWAGQVGTVLLLTRQAYALVVVEFDGYAEALAPAGSADEPCLLSA